MIFCGWDFVSMCTTCMPGAHGDQKRVSGHLGLKFQTVVDRHAGGGNLCGSSERTVAALNC